MKPTRIRSQKAARKYVARCMATTLQNDFDSGAHWLNRSSLDGNLDGQKSEELVHQAARELIEQLLEAAR